MAPNLITRDQNVDDVSSENSAPEETKKIPRPCNQLPTIVIVSHDTAYDQLLPRQSLYLDYPYHCTQQHYWRSKKATFLFSIVILVLLALFCITIIATTNIVKQVKEANRNNKNKNLSLAVQTSCGPLNGENHGNHIVFRGIPFAVPPTGEHRWSHPVPNLQSAGQCHLKGQGTGPATANPVVCPQRSAQTGQMIGQENCLYLSIRLPRQAFKRATNLPVVVVMQGEGQHFEADEGFGGKHFESIRPLVLQGASVIVSVNYRLGVFGFLSLDSTTDNTTLMGNYGLMDQILALQWIKENIEHFNGDPKSVIVYGESSGSEALSGLLRSPKSQNLFHGMIVMDPEWMPIRPVDDAMMMMKDLNLYNETLKTTCGEKDIIECLKQMESRKIVESLSEIHSNSVNETPLQTQLKQYLRPLNRDFSLTIDEITLFPDHGDGYEISSPKQPNIPVFIGQVCRHFCGTWKDRPHSLTKRIGQLFKIETEIAAGAAVKLYTRVEEARRTEADMVSEMAQDITMCQTEKLLRSANYPLYYLVSPLRKSSLTNQCRSNSSKRLQQMHNSPFLCSRNLHKELTQGTSTGKSLPTENGITDANAKAETDPDLHSLWKEIFSTVAVVAHRRDSAALFQPKHSNHIISVAPVGPAEGVCHFWDKHRSF